MNGSRGDLHTDVKRFEKVQGYDKSIMRHHVYFNSLVAISESKHDRG